MSTQTSLYEKLIAYGIVICLFFPSSIIAQTLVRHLLSPEVSASMLQVNSIKKAKYADEKALLQSATTDELEVLTIPMIFHIVFQNELHRDELQRVDEQEITNQLAVLNNAFSGQGTTESFEHLAESREGYGQLSAKPIPVFNFVWQQEPMPSIMCPSEIEEWGARFWYLARRRRASFNRTY